MAILVQKLHVTVVLLGQAGPLVCWAQLVSLYRPKLNIGANELKFKYKY
ncbi:uncharacterized protein G2W53_019167 [Senna tora]|uniref:Uncharacterized protein n=1 Tax=Senna tora TaxID=362788 RepID=A0A834WNZ9_9FABA|nr:uncharacterized protein G2W53_019167 [Senna tora]